MKDAKGTPERSSSTIGITALLVLVSIAAVRMYLGPSSAAAPAGLESRSLSTEGPEQVAGFRSDAWYLPDAELLGFVEVSGGPFLMGSDVVTDPQALDHERWSDGSAQGIVDLPTFYISRSEVTVAQFRAFVEATGFAADSRVFQAPPEYPVRPVSWTDALAYSRWLQSQLQASLNVPAALRELFDEGWRVTLPSEAEWEKAARGADGRLYPWGNEPRADRANFAETGTMPVGSFECPECPYPLFDMSGNVWEWTRSPYEPYPYDASDDRDNLEADGLWVIRGGSYQDSAREVRAASRAAAGPGVRRPFIGFRVAISRF
jgi:formylglycine-generating enzyme required for sulfatase activity